MKKSRRPQLSPTLEKLIYGDTLIGERNEFYRRLWRYCRVGILLIQTAMFVSLILLAFEHDVRNMPTDRVVSIAVDGLIVLLSAMMFLSMNRQKLPDRLSVYFSLLIAAVTLYVFLDGYCWMIDGYRDLRIFNVIANFAYYCCGILLSWLYWHFLRAWYGGTTTVWVKSGSYAVDFLAVVAVLLAIGNLFGEYYYKITENGMYQRERAYAASLVMPVVLMTVCVAYIIRMKVKWSEKIVLICYPLFPYAILFALADSEGSGLLAVSVFLSLFFVYSNLYVRRERERIAKQQELAESKLNAMLLQINPHFIYNTIGSAASLCREDPAQAEQMLLAFSSYLRNNSGELAKKSMIPIKQELEHLKAYITIEKMRFPDITVEFDCRDTDFELPTLSIQPLVENAIKHGLLGRESGGTVRISVREEGDLYVITVEDDGVGFEDKPKNDGRTHVGIANVRSRLELLCNGTLDITSTVGVGTKACIRIPKTGEGRK